MVLHLFNYLVTLIYTLKFLKNRLCLSFFWLEEGLWTSSCFHTSFGISKYNIVLQEFFGVRYLLICIMDHNNNAFIINIWFCFFFLIYKTFAMQRACATKVVIVVNIFSYINLLLFVIKKKKVLKRCGGKNQWLKLILTSWRGIFCTLHHTCSIKIFSNIKKQHFWFFNPFWNNRVPFWNHMLEHLCKFFFFCFLPISKVVKVALYKLEHGIFVEQMANLVQCWNIGNLKMHYCDMWCACQLWQIIWHLYTHVSSTSFLSSIIEKFLKKCKVDIRNQLS